MRISVTANHIHLGETNNDEGCPVFLALVEELGDRVRSVDGEGAWLDTGFIAFPTKVWAFIRLFDKNQDVYPFSFELAGV